MSPTARTVAECRKRGWPATVVERFTGRVRRDAFGFGDVLVLDGQPGALLIQCTTGAHVANRVTKIRTQCAEAAAVWLAAGNRIEVWGWALQGPAGSRKRWTLRRVLVD